MGLLRLLTGVLVRRITYSYTDDSTAACIAECPCQHEWRLTEVGNLELTAQCVGNPTGKSLPSGNQLPLMSRCGGEGLGIR